MTSIANVVSRTSDTNLPFDLSLSKAAVVSSGAAQAASIFDLHFCQIRSGHSTMERLIAQRKQIRALKVWLTLIGAACMLFMIIPASAQTQITNTVHNLTPEGPGRFKETRPIGLCAFCHTPHNANPTRGLWNRDLPAISYQLYTSSTLKATLNQPSGSSRLCLSCHDGILALGNLRVPPPGEALKLGPMTGSNVLGTDLSDDHPVSFAYDNALAVKHVGLVDPGSLPITIRLDQNKEMQCTSCHDPHEDRRPKFLRMSNLNGALCLTCHRPAQWSGSSHANSSATWNGAGTNPWPADAPTTVAANACRNCHHNHAAGHGQRLLAQAIEPDNCTICHGGTVAAKNISAEFANAAKPSRHPIENVPWTHDPTENPQSMSRHVTCADCHNAHAANANPGQSPLVRGPLLSVAGVTSSGSPVAESAYEYQICIKCHGFSEPTMTIGITRVDATRIVSTKIDPSNSSYHPIAAQGRNTTIQGLLPGYTAASIITCGDCHNNNEWTPSGTVPRGPHASRFAPILERNYVSNDPTPESPANYDLCYKCHDRASLLSESGAFRYHLKHVVEKQAPCSACHDAHGSRQNKHLINFMLRDSSGNQVVSANSQGRLEYNLVGNNGTCYLMCHGKDHKPEKY
jgi:predicted CXXCH cytochrome family protein